MNNPIDILNIDNLKRILNMTEIPAEINISTMTMLCEFNTTFNIANIGNYAPLSQTGINSIKYVADGEIKERNIFGISTVKQKRKTKKEKSNFYNQTTMIVRCLHDEKLLFDHNKKIGKKTKKPIKTTNIKIFQNGAVQLTGCKSIEGFYQVLGIVCRELTKIRGIPNKKFDTITKISFVSKPESLTLNNILRPRIAMINSDYNIGYSIDRDQLHSILKDVSIFEPDKHAPVNIKYEYKDRKKISIFVFESGAIVITGVNNSNQIVKAYNYINTVIGDNFSKVVLIDKNSFVDVDLKKYIDKNDIKKGVQFDPDFQETLIALIKENK